MPKNNKMPADVGGDPSALLPAPEPVDPPGKTYAQYLAESRPSRYEVPKRKPLHRDDPETVRQAIERVKAAVKNKSMTRTRVVVPPARRHFA